MAAMTEVRFSSPIGPLTATAGPTGLTALSFVATGPRTATTGPTGLTASSFVATGQRDASELVEADHSPTDPVIALLHAQLAEYFAGSRREFSVPLDWSPLTGFRGEVLRALVSVPYGQTTSYGGLAAACGRPGAARLVGTIMGSNPFPILVPCHRVLASDGGIGGYGGGYHGVPIKRKLLELEGAIPASLFD